MPNAQCLMPNAPMPQCPNAQCPMPNAQWPVPHAPMTSPMCNASCARLQAEAVPANETVTVESGEGGWCSAAYLITHAGAKLLRAAQTPVWLAADELFKYYT